MKNKLKIFSTSALSALLFLGSCTKEDKEGTVDNLDDLKSVSFEAIPDNVLTSVKTGATRFNNTTNSTDFEYLTTVEKQNTLVPLSIVGANNLDIIYPGSILRGSSFIDATYDPLVLQNEFNKVELSMTLRGKDLPVSAQTPPKLSSVRNTINTLLESNQNLINFDAVPANYSYESNSVSTEESFNKTLDIHVKVNVLAGLVKTDFSYNQSSGTSSEKKYVLVEVRQQFYNAAIDPKNYKDWVDGAIDPKDLGSHEPLYVSSVDYGRVAYLLIESSKDEAYNSTMIKASVSVALKVVSASTDVTLSNEFKSLFQQNKVKVLIAGGPAEIGGRVTDYDSFVLFLQTPTVRDLVGTAVPISYKVRRLLDNTEVVVKQLYKEQLLEYKPQ